MSMLDAFFNKRFQGAKCKTLLKLVIPRIKLLRNRREIQLKQMRRDIAKLLENGQEATARIRVEHIIREENMMAAQEILELFCELIAVRIPIIETQRECPLDLKEAISSLCFAAPRCSDLPELQQVQMLFAAKYGKEFVAAATELMPDCGVNRQIIELLSVRAPSAEVKLKLLKEIAEEHELDWDPSASETEYLKPHADLLNGPSQFISASKLPPPQEKHEESLPSNIVPPSNEHSDSDTGSDSLDLPEVPKVSLKPSSNAGSAPENAPSFSAPPDLGDDDEIGKATQENETSLQDYHSQPEAVVQEPKDASPYASVNFSDSGIREEKKFLPFVSPPSLSSASFSVRESEPTIPSASQINPPSLSRTKSEANVDLQDVLAAAQAAAESAERAAAAARSAASLAQVRITELGHKRSDQVRESADNKFNESERDPDHVPAAETPPFDRQQSISNNVSASHSLDAYPDGGPRLPNAPSYDSPKLESDALGSYQRSTSLEEDPYFSYPNLFTSPDPNLKSDIYSSANNSPSLHKSG